MTKNTVSKWFQCLASTEHKFGEIYGHKYKGVGFANDGEFVRKTRAYELGLMNLKS